MDKSDKIVKVKYLEEVYSKVKIQNLIAFGVYSVIENGEICTYERLVAECFSNFPKVFGFKRYPQWPDSLKFDRPLRILREEGLIIGSVRDRFELTEFGREKAKETGAILGRTYITTNKKTRTIGRSVDDRLIEKVIDSDPFKRFIRNPEDFAISESEFRSLLRCTLETPKRILKQNLKYYKNVAEFYNEERVLDFLTTCENNLIKIKS